MSLAGMNDIICYGVQIDQAAKQILLTKHYLEKIDQKPEIIYSIPLPCNTNYLCQHMTNDGDLGICSDDGRSFIIAKPSQSSVQVFAPEIPYPTVAESIGFSDNSWVVYCNFLNMKDENQEKIYYDSFFKIIISGGLFRMEPWLVMDKMSFHRHLLFFEDMVGVVTFKSYNNIDIVCVKDGAQFHRSLSYVGPGKTNIPLIIRYRLGFCYILTEGLNGCFQVGKQRYIRNQFTRVALFEFSLNDLEISFRPKSSVLDMCVFDNMICVLYRNTSGYLCLRNVQFY